MLIIVITCIIVHVVLVFYGLRSHRKFINLFKVATRRPLRGEVYNLSLSLKLRSPPKINSPTVSLTLNIPSMEASTVELESTICSVCFQAVKSNQKTKSCNVCLCWVRQRCVRLSNDEYNKLGSVNDPCFCSSCLTNIFPFNKIPNEAEFVLSSTNM